VTVKTADGADELRQLVRAQDNKRHKQHDRQLLAAEVEHTTSLNSDGRPLAAATHRPLVEAWQGDFAASALLPPGPDPPGAVTTPTARIPTRAPRSFRVEPVDTPCVAPERRKATGSAALNLGYEFGGIGVHFAHDPLSVPQPDHDHFEGASLLQA